MKKVLFLVPYPPKHAPSQRFRIEVYEPYMREAGIKYRIEPFFDDASWHILYRQGGAFQKAWGFVKGYLRRLFIVFLAAPSYDFIFIHREAAPLGPPVFEWILSQLLRKKIVYDFDDAIWLPNTSKENSIAGKLKAFWKVKYICKWSYKIAAGNRFLCNYAAQFNSAAVLLPTCVDTNRTHNKLKHHKSHGLIVGWTGSHSTLFYLKEVLPVIAALQQRYEFTFAVIADKDPAPDLSRYKFIPWNENTEIDDLLAFDIGVMPLTPDNWSEGKCGFKLIQYLAMGIPAVASSVGVNKQILRDSVNGFFADSAKEWEDALEKLLDDVSLRQRMGKAGRDSIVQSYSIQAHLNGFLNLLT